MYRMPTDAIRQVSRGMRRPFTPQWSSTYKNPAARMLNDTCPNSRWVQLEDENTLGEGDSQRKAKGRQSSGSGFNKRRLKRDAR